MGGDPLSAKTLKLDPSGVTRVNETISSNVSVYGMIVSREGRVLADDRWYYCTKCLDAGDRIRSRLSIMAKFCPECGTELDWKETDDG